MLTGTALAQPGSRVGGEMEMGAGDVLTAWVLGGREGGCEEPAEPPASWPKE